MDCGLVTPAVVRYANQQPRSRPPKRYATEIANYCGCLFQAQVAINQGHPAVVVIRLASDVVANAGILEGSEG